MSAIKSAQMYDTLIRAYFEHIKGTFHIENLPVKNAKDGEAQTIPTKVWDREPEPALLSALALYLGFNSREEFDTYEHTGEHKVVIKRARLMIEAEYEKKLHQQAPTGAIFALKSMGWNEKADSVPASEAQKSLLVQVVQAGPVLANSEKEIEITLV